jgi:S1-C subfamily serine protease
MRRFVIFGISIVLLIILLLHMQSEPKNPENQIRSSFDSTCTVRTVFIGGFGTGTLLDTGYILTAAHVVDIDRDGKLTPDERTCIIQFRGEDEIEARVVYLSSLESDFALLEPAPGFVGNKHLVASKRAARLGEPIYTIGATAGHSPHITNGYISTPDFGRGRASCFISGGNSGGAIISEGGEHLGIVVAVGVRHAMDMAQSRYMTKDKKLRILQTMVRRRVEVSSLCLFIPIEEVRLELMEKKLRFLLDVPPQPSLSDYYLNHPFTTPAALIFLKLYLLFGFIFYVRKHLFG